MIHQRFQKVYQLIDDLITLPSVIISIIIEYDNYKSCPFKWVATIKQKRFPVNQSILYMYAHNKYVNISADNRLRINDKELYCLPFIKPREYVQYLFDIVNNVFYFLQRINFYKENEGQKLYVVNLSFNSYLYELSSCCTVFKIDSFSSKLTTIYGSFSSTVSRFFLKKKAILNPEKKIKCPKHIIDFLAVGEYYIYVAEKKSRNIKLIEKQNMKIIQNIRAFSSISSMAIFDEDLFVSSSHTITIFSYEGFLQQHMVDDKFRNMSFDAFGIFANCLYVANITNRELYTFSR